MELSFGQLLMGDPVIPEILWVLCVCIAGGLREFVLERTRGYLLGGFLFGLVGVPS